MNLGKTKAWYDMSYQNFQRWAEKSGIPWRLIKPHLDDTLQKAKDLWPQAIQDLPMREEHKAKLKAHWGNLHEDFRF